MKTVSRLILVCLGLGMLTACGPKPGQDIGAVVNDAEQLAAAGQVDKALSRLDRYYRSPAYENARFELLMALVRIERGAGRMEGACSRFAAAAAHAPGPAQQVLGAFLRQKEWDVAEALLAKVEAGLGNLPGWGAAAVNARIDLVLGRDGYARAVSLLAGQLPTLPDEVAARNVKTVGEAALRSAGLAEADTLYEAALAVAPDHARTRAVAAEGWVRVEGRRGSVAGVMERLERLQQGKLPPVTLLNLASEYYPLLLGKGDEPIFKRLYSVCAGIDAQGMSTGEKSYLSGMMLDISYYLKDFELALRLVESGGMGLEGDDKAQMLAKIRYHLAEKNGQPREAVRHLREFMGYIAKREVSEVDPVNRCRITREMILGLNARRVGDLCAAAGEIPEARAAYDEARGYYQKALASFPDANSAEHRKITSELGAIPRP